MFIDNIKKWYASPLNGKGSVTDYFLFVGIIFIAAFFWSRVIARIA